MKTIEKWLEKLPEPIRTKAISQIEPKNCHWEEESESLYDALNSFCIWGNTKEGEDYWNDVCYLIEEGNIDEHPEVLAYYCKDAEQKEEEIEKVEYGWVKIERDKMGDAIEILGGLEKLLEDRIVELANANNYSNSQQARHAYLYYRSELWKSMEILSGTHALSYRKNKK